MHLITGYAGEEHIKSSDIGAFQAAITDISNWRLQLNQIIHASMTGASSNAVQVSEGYGLFQGRLFGIEEAETLYLEPVAVGFYQKDLIVARYEKNPETLIETISLVAISGTPTTRESSAVLPSYNNGSILSGDAIVDMPLFEIDRTYSGGNIIPIAPILDNDVITADDIDAMFGETSIRSGEGVLF